MKNPLFLLIFLSALWIGCKDKSAQNDGTNQPTEIINKQAKETVEIPSTVIIEKADYEAFKSYFPDVIFGEKFSLKKHQLIKKEGIASLLYIADDRELADGTMENIYGLGKITGYKDNMDIFIIKHDHTRADEGDYEGNSENHIYVIMFKDGDFIKRNETEIILKHTLEIENYGEGGHSKLTSIFNKDHTITSHFFSSESESSTGYNTPLITNVTYTWYINEEGSVEITDISLYNFDSPFYDLDYITEKKEYWEKWGNIRNYPNKNDKFPICSSNTYINWEYPVSLFNNDITIYFYMNDNSGNLYPVLESRDENQNLISSYTVGYKENSNYCDQEVDYSHRSHTLSCRIFINTSDGDVEILPDGRLILHKP